MATVDGNYDEGEKQIGEKRDERRDKDGLEDRLACHFPIEFVTHLCKAQKHSCHAHVDFIKNRFEYDGG